MLKGLVVGGGGGGGDTGDMFDKTLLLHKN